MSGTDPSGYKSESVKVTDETEFFQDADGNQYVSAGDGSGDLVKAETVTTTSSNGSQLSMSFGNNGKLTGFTLSDSTGSVQGTEIGSQQQKLEYTPSDDGGIYPDSDGPPQFNGSEVVENGAGGTVVVAGAHEGEHVFANEPKIVVESTLLDDRTVVEQRFVPIGTSLPQTLIVSNVRSPKWLDVIDVIFGNLLYNQYETTIYSVREEFFLEQTGTVRSDSGSLGFTVLMRRPLGERIRKLVSTRKVRDESIGLAGVLATDGSRIVSPQCLPYSDC